ncbi:MAG: dihydroorotate dehydrogenase-like protein [Marinilabiliales bacterium]|nr:MAG: dihydroorotate dehydrogenase-like protein [Marinilabiliales bacterium]
MPNLEVNYMGIKLKNPVIAGSSGLTASIEKIRTLEEAGAGAVVLKSLFEEQINYEAGSLIMNHDYPEAEDYIRNYTKSNSVENYLSLIEEAKKVVSIPVIASINCITASDWVSFSRRIEEAGADALELNVYYLPTDKFMPPADFENIYYDLVSKVTGILKIPVAIKLGNHFTNLLGLVDRLYALGARGVVLFNRFYEPDIDIDRMKLTSADVFSNPSDLRHVLRWTALVSDKVSLVDISASTGVHSWEAVVKQLLAGAKTVQVCSLLYKSGLKEAGTLVQGLSEWMEKKGFDSVDAFRGKMSYRNIPDPSVYERSQFMKYFSGIH